MNALTTEGIILSRTNYGEADRILTILTPDQGKLRLMAKGVRKIKSKLAGGIELFSISELSYISGKNEIGTLVSSRLKTNYSQIVKEIDRVQLGYELLMAVNRVTEDHPETFYFELLADAFMALDDFEIDTELIRLWFMSHLLRANGHSPNLFSDENDNKLDEKKNYSFDFESMNFTSKLSGPKYSSRHIKLLRLLFGSYNLKQISKIENVSSSIKELSDLIEKVLWIYLPVNF